MRTIEGRPIYLAPLAVTAWYVAIAVADERGLAKKQDLWIYLAMAFVGAVGYLVFLGLGFLASWAQRQGLVASRLALFVSGMATAFLSALVADLPHINLQRWAYYASAVMSGAMWAVALWVVGNLTNRSSGRASGTVTRSAR